MERIRISHLTIGLCLSVWAMSAYSAPASAEPAAPGSPVGSDSAATDAPAADRAETEPAGEAAVQEAPAAEPTTDEAPRESADSAPAAGPTSDAREFLRLYDMDDAFFASFLDDEPLAFDEQEKLFRLLYRVRRLQLVQMQRWTRGAAAWRQLTGRPAEFRGEIFRVEGVVQRVEPIPLSPELRERFEMPACYRCRMLATDGTLVFVVTSVVPREWALNEPLDMRASFTGMFVKRMRRGGDGEPEERPLVFLAPRVAWYPSTPLGQLRMDVGLLDEVRDARPITEDERECFYQLLGAVEHSQPKALEAEAEKTFVRRRQELEAELPAMREQPKQLARAQHELAQLSAHQSDVLPLFLEPDASRGKLVVLEGRARRAVEVQVDDADIVERFGIKHYYELEIFTDDSQGNPVVCCVRELTPGMPTGDGLSERVRVAGFFLKSWMYRAHPGGARKPGDAAPVAVQRLAPLVIARRAEWIPHPGVQGQTLIGTLTAAGLVIICGVILWILWRSTRRPHQTYREIIAASKPGGLGREDSPPDFSRLK